MIFPRQKKIRISRSGNAFTLLELLAAIAILAILGAMLIPASKNMIAAANRVKSASNIKQIGTALQATAADLNGCFPSVSHNGGVTGSQGVWNRCEPFASQLPLRSNGTPNIIFVAPGNGYGFPAASISSTYSAGGALFGFRTDLETPTLTRNVQRSLLQIHKPSTAVLVMEGKKLAGFTYCETAVSLSVFKNDMLKTEADTTSGVHFRYDGKSNVLFADGHVEAFSLNQMKQEITPEEFTGCDTEPASP